MTDCTSYIQYIHSTCTVCPQVTICILFSVPLLVNLHLHHRHNNITAHDKTTRTNNMPPIEPPTIPPITLLPLGPLLMGTVKTKI